MKKILFTIFFVFMISLSVFSDDEKLLCHFDGSDGATSSTDSSPSAHTLTFNGDAELDTAIKKWGDSALLLAGSNGHVDASGSLSDFDIANFTNYTIDLWCKFSNATVAGDEAFFSYYKDASNLMYLGKAGPSGYLVWVWKDGGTNRMAFFETTATSISNTNMNHIMACKIGTNIGYYVNGSERPITGYSDPTLSSIISSNPFVIGNYQDGKDLAGTIDEFRMIATNSFSASPSDGAGTDTIVVPTGPYGAAAASAQAIFFVME